jgi:serine/threonine protein kinase
MTSLIGLTLLDQYYLRELVGQGGMADVYLAWDRLRATKMAVKVLRRDLVSNPKSFQLFAKEAELLRRLEHPNIVRLYEFGKEDDIVFIIMDWVEGTNLRQAIVERKKPFSLPEVSGILQPVCSALHFAHQSRVFHCDVKPANILIHVDGRVLLSDFGVARLATDNISGGTPPYMAPEQFSGSEVDARTDIYALGITIFEMLTGGKVPFRGESPSSQGSTVRARIAWEHMNLQPVYLNELNHDVPIAVADVIATALNKVSSQRYASTLEFRDAFEQAYTSVSKAKIKQSFITGQPNYPPKIPTRQTPPQPRPVTRSGQLGQDNFGQSKGPYLLGRSGNYTGQKISINADNLTIGRSSSNSLKVKESSVSRIHAMIIRTKRGVYIRDENSSVGTLLNGQRIQPTVPLKLHNGDIIQIGYYQVFEFHEK